MLDLTKNICSLFAETTFFKMLFPQLVILSTLCLYFPMDKIEVVKTWPTTVKIFPTLNCVLFIDVSKQQFCDFFRLVVRQAASFP